LTKFDKLYKDVALDIHLGKNRGESKKLTKAKKEELNPSRGILEYSSIV
jgi:hypothetical protein